MEAILFPSSTIVNSFESYNVQTTDGRIETGIIHRADNRTLVLRDSQRIDIVISRKDIDHIQKSTQSMMPRGLETNLSTSELSDLVAYLESLDGETEN